ncbi:MAG: aminotransferase class III-fold pyridoxal phosphate-dependent enzyme [Gammaproteobacteria bacterium]|jgi:diaminobutyrate-2-oxoglutarate transaminase|nr:aminotransferase class III-fold pyridoxal phosphate-dependent enzyme [Gammaproteobacteria bacterium]
MQVFEQWESDIRGYCRLYPTVFKSASNARQTDEQGKSYIDFFAGAGVLNFGHNNARMKRAMIDFMERDGVAHSLDMYTDVKRDFIAKFVDTIVKPRGWNHKLQFMGPTGTNAVETALKLARKATGRRTVVAYEHGFHGMTLGSLACTANAYFRNAAGVPLDHVFRQPFGSDEVELEQCLAWVDQLRHMYADSSSGLEPPAAFLIEPIQAEGGVHVARPEWLKAVQDLARDLGALVIYDDIQAGCGRTGQYFSFDGMELDPDIITLAKGIGGFGTPMAMNLVKPEYDKHWSPGEHTGTFRGQGLSFVAGTVALEYFDDDELMNVVRSHGETMRERLESIAAQQGGGAFSVRGRGMMQALDVGDGDLAKHIASSAFESGLLIGACGTGGRTLKLIPPLTIPEADLAEGLDILERSIASARRAAA